MTAGKGGDDLAPFATENLPWLRDQYLRHVLGIDSSGWTAAQTALAENSHPIGQLESK